MAGAVLLSAVFLIIWNKFLERIGKGDFYAKNS